MLSVWQQTMSSTLVGDPYWKDVTLLLGIDETGVSNLKTGAPLTLSGSAALSATNTAAGNTRSIHFPATGSPFATMADDPSLTFGTGDFTIEWNWFPRTPTVVSGVAVLPLFYWGTWAASPRPVNFEVLVNATNSTTAMSVTQHGSGVWQVANVEPLSRMVTHAIVRKNGMISYYTDGVRNGDATSYPTSFNHPTIQPFYIGRRVGGTTGNVNWYFNGYISALRMTKAARYDGSSYSVPVGFPAS